MNSGDGYGETAGSSSGVFEVTYSLQNVGSLAGSGIDAVATYTDLDDDILGLGSASGPRAWLEPSFWDSVNLIDSGAGMFSGRGSFVLTKCWGVPCVGGSGAFEYLLQVDFGAGTFGGNGSMVSLWAKYPGDGVGPVDIAAGMEVLNENLNIPAGQLALLSQTNGSLTVDFTLADVGGSAAGGLDVAVRYDDVGNGHFGEGYSYGLWTQLADFDALQTEPGTGLFQGGGELRLQACPGGPCVTPVGAFNYAVLVDFTNRKFGGLGSMAWISGGDVFQNQYFNDSMAIPETPYTDLTTVAVSGPKSSQSSRFRMEFSLKNVTWLASDMDAAAF
ncbi:MAG: hypothetical protein HZB91_11245 [Elusimicrobia bacterium]|nr:hypothetical protein [Elusimicrobiota bacterium]